MFPLLGMNALALVIICRRMRSSRIARVLPSDSVPVASLKLVGSQLSSIVLKCSRISLMKNIRSCLRNLCLTELVKFCFASCGLDGMKNILALMKDNNMRESNPRKNQLTIFR